MEVDELFSAKIRCLEKYVSLSRNLLSELEVGVFEHLENTYHERDTILRAIELYDSRIDQALLDLPADKVSEERMNRIKQLMEQWKAHLHQAYDLDAQMIALIEKEKDSVQAEMAQTQKSRDVIKRFHSQSGKGSGEGLDQQG